MRDICEITGFLIKEVIPVDQVAVRDGIELVAKRAMYTAPEQQQPYWEMLGVVLNNGLGNADTEWKQKVKRIVNGEEEIPKPLLRRILEALEYQYKLEPQNELTITALQDAHSLINAGMKESTILHVAEYYLDYLTRANVNAVQTTLPLERAAWCCSQIPVLIAEGRKDKAMRWMCFAQGVLFTKGVFTVEDLMVHSRGEVDLRTLINCGTRRNL